jgi:hypothetical protein
MSIKGLELVAYLGLNEVTVETNAQNLKRALKSNDFDRAELGVIFREIKTKWLLILIVVIFLNAIGLVIL